MHLNVYRWVCILRKDRKICRTAQGRPERWTNVRREEDQFVFIGPLFLFSVLRQSLPLSFPAPPPPPARPSAPCVSFAAKPLHAQSSLIRAWLSAGRILRHRFCHRNGQLLMENYRLFAFEFFIIEYRFYLNFADDKINGTSSKIKSISKIWQLSIGLCSAKVFYTQINPTIFVPCNNSFEITLCARNSSISIRNYL